MRKRPGKPLKPRHSAGLPVSSVVLDASAILALVFGEPGADKVLECLGKAAVSAVNLEEVASKWMMKGAPLDSVTEKLNALDLECVPFSREQAFVAASLRPLCESKGLSRADRSCLALGLERNAPILTTDGKWVELDIGVSVTLIR